MAEESVINYWEKYGNIAFDNGQKAVLTSCLLKNPDTANSPTSPSGSAGVINCCFSFTIRRDRYNMYFRKKGFLILQSELYCGQFYSYRSLRIVSVFIGYCGVYVSILGVDF